MTMVCSCGRVVIPVVPVVEVAVCDNGLLLWPCGHSKLYRWWRWQGVTTVCCCGRVVIPSCTGGGGVQGVTTTDHLV